MQKGIALLQVLLITAVLSLLALFITNTAKQQVAIAKGFDDRTQALVDNYSAEASLLFALLSERKSPTAGPSPSIPEVTAGWNFHSTPFVLSHNTTVRLQDLRGLLNLNFPSEQRWLRMLTQLGLQDYDARLLLNRIKDWQDVDSTSRYSLKEQDYKNGVIQVWPELSHISMPKYIELFLVQNSTMYKGSTFNPMTSPDSLIMSLFDGSVARQIIQLRNNSSLTPTIFLAYTGLVEGNKVTLYPSNNFRISLETQVGSSRVKRTLYYLLQPKNANPVNLVSSEG